MPNFSLEKLSGSGAVGGMMTVLVDKFTTVDFTLEETGVVALGLSAIITFVINRLGPKKEAEPQQEISE